MKKEIPERAFTEGRLVYSGELLRYLAISDERSDVAYMVDLLEGECNCPDAVIRKRKCKHYYRALIEWAEETLEEIRKKTKYERTKNKQDHHRDGDERMDRHRRVPASRVR